MNSRTLPVVSRRTLRLLALTLGLLIVAGVVAASLGKALSPPSRTVLVATSVVPAGNLLSANDFTQESVTPTSTKGSWPFPDSLLAISHVRATVEITPGTVLETSMETDSNRADSQREMTVAVPADNVPPSSLLPGARIDIAATYGSGTGASTILVGTGLPVISVIDSSTTGNAEITIAIGHQITALAIAQALQLAKITVINTTGTNTNNTNLSYPPSTSASGE